MCGLEIALNVWSPNIYGEIRDIPHGSDANVLVTGTGAFTVTMGRSAGNGNGGGYTHDARFNASQYNGTYDGSYLQPKALSALACIRF